MSKKCGLICFMGMDGSGKTTLSNNLLKELGKDSSKLIYVWCKFGQNGPFLKKILNLFSFIVLKPKKDKKIEDFPEKKEIKKNFFSKTYLYFLLFIHNLEIILKITIPLRRGSIIICDRYIPDTLVDIVLEFGYDYDTAIDLTNKLRFVPQPDYSFYINISPENAFQRKKENNIKYLSKKKLLYDRYSKQNKVEILDGTINIDELIKEISKTIRCENG